MILSNTNISRETSRTGNGNHANPAVVRERGRVRVRVRAQAVVSSSLARFATLTLVFLVPQSSDGFFMSDHHYQPSKNHYYLTTREKQTRYQFNYEPFFRQEPQQKLTKTRTRAMSPLSAEAFENNNIANEHATIPQHVAIVCDGNSRWAKKRLLSTADGHAAGAIRLTETLQNLKDVGVTYCTFYGFSTENWKRSQGEINKVFFVMEQTARNFHDRALKKKIRIKILGDLEDDRIPVALRDVLYKLEQDTAAIPVNDTKMTLCIAVNYGGRQDIIKAAMKLASEQASSSKCESSLDKEKIISEKEFSSLLCTNNIPDPDLIIRTGGERRLSNFLLWNAAYSELYFSDVLWPDFDERCLGKTLDWYAGRCRRFGGRGENEHEKLIPTATPANNGHII